MRRVLILVFIAISYFVNGQIAPYPDLTYDQFLCTEETFKTQTICLNNRIPEEDWGPLVNTLTSPCSYAPTSLPIYNNTPDYPAVGTPCAGVCCGTNLYTTYADAFTNRTSYYTIDLVCLNNPTNVSITKVNEMCWNVIYLDTGNFLFSLNLTVRYGRDIDGYYCEDTIFYNPCGEDRSWKQFVVSLGNQYPCNDYISDDCNLVTNGGFEDEINCPTYNNSITPPLNDDYIFSLLLDWTELTNGQEPYFYSTCNNYFGSNGTSSSLFESYPPQPLPSGDNYVGLYFSSDKFGQALDLCQDQKYQFQFVSTKYRGNFGAGVTSVNLEGINAPSLPSANPTTPLTTVTVSNVSLAWNTYSSVFTSPSNFNGIVISGTQVMVDNISITPIDTVILNLQLLANRCDSGEMILNIPGCYGPYDVDVVVGSDTLNLIQIQDGEVITIPISSNTIVKVLSITNSINCTTIINESDTLVINNAGNADFTSQDFCEGDNNVITFLADTGTFSLVNNLSSASINPTTGIISGAIAPTTFIIKHTVCLDTVYDTIQVIKHDASFTSSNICQGGVNTITIAGELGGVFSFVSPALGATINPSTGVITGATAGNNYTIQYKVGTICADSTTQVVQAVSVEDPSFTTSDFCVNSSNVVTVTGVTGGTFSFTPLPTDGASINSNTGVVSNPTVGNSYTIQYVTPGNCKDSSTQTVTVLDLPTASISGVGGDLCVQDSFPLTITLTGVPPWDITYTNGTSSFTVNGVMSSPYTVYAKTAGQYQVAQVKDAQCTNVGDTNSLVSITGDSINFWSDLSEGCEPQEIQFWSSYNGAGGDCLWDFGDGNSESNCDTVTHVYQTSGLYSVRLTISSLGCNVDTVINNFITVFDNPQASFYYKPTAPTIVNNKIRLTNTSINNDINLWFLDSSIVSSLVEPDITLPANIGYNNLCLIVQDTNGCLDTTCTIIYVKDELLMYIPNAFVPDANGLNDVFLPIVSNVVEYEFRVFNRWGENIFKTTNTTEGWDGTFNNEPCKEDTYVYRIVFKYEGDIHNREVTGHVNLLR